MLEGIHHIAIICSDIERSKSFYCDILGFKVIREVFRPERRSWKIDLSLNGSYILELFTFPDSPNRGSYPEANGLRHLAFSVSDIEKVRSVLEAKEVGTENIRIDATTGKKFFFFSDPDGLPIEIYEK